RPVARRARALGLHLYAREDGEAFREAARGVVRVFVNRDGRGGARGDEAEDAPAFGDVLLVLNLPAQDECVERGVERLGDAALADESFGEEAVVLGETDEARGGRKLNRLPKV